MTDQRTQWRQFALLQGTLFLYSVASVFSKLSGVRRVEGDTSGALWFLVIAVALLGAYSLLWQLVLKRMPLNKAYSSKGVQVLWTCLFGLLLFQESLTWGKAIGIVVVLVGVYLVVSDHD